MCGVTRASARSTLQLRARRTSELACTGAAGKCESEIPIQQQPIFTSPAAVMGGPNASVGAGAPFQAANQRRTASKTTNSTPTMKMIIRTVSRYPVNTWPGFEVSGQNIFLIDKTPAVTVVTPTKHMGIKVIQA